MDPGDFLIFLLIFGIIGFIVQKIFGWNPYIIYEHIGAVILVSGIILLFFPILLHPEDINGNINRTVNFFTDILPGEIVGEIAGAMLGTLLGGRK